MLDQQSTEKHEANITDQSLRPKLDAYWEK